MAHVRKVRARVPLVKVLADPVAIEAAKRDGELPQIVAMWTNRKFPCTPQCVDSVSFER